MADQTFKNVINGELVDSVSGETYDIIDPTTGEVYAQAPKSGAEDVDRAYAAAAAAFESWGDTTPQERATALLKIADAIDARADEIIAVECKDTGKPLGLTVSEEMPPTLGPLPVLRRRRAGARGQVGGRVHERPHLVGPPRADRRRRPGDAVELPADDDDLEDRPGARRGQHRRPQAERHHAGAARRCWPSCARSSCRRACSTSSAATATPAARWSRTRPRRWSRSPARCGPAWRSPSSAAADLKRVHLELGGKAPVIVFDDADIEKAAGAIAEAGLLQRRPGLHRRHPGARRAGRPRRLRRGAHRGGEGHQDRHARRRGRPLRRRSTTSTSSSGSPAWSTGCPTTPTSRPAARARATSGYFYEPTVLSGLQAGRRADPDGDLRPGHHRAEVQRRGRGAALGQRRRVRPGLQRLDQGPRPGDADVASTSTSASSGSTPTSRSSPRCRTAASSTPATARTSPCTASRTTRASSTSCPTSVSDA